MAPVTPDPETELRHRRAELAQLRRRMHELAQRWREAGMTGTDHYHMPEMRRAHEMTLLACAHDLFDALACSPTFPPDPHHPDYENPRQWTRDREPTGQALAAVFEDGPTQRPCLVIDSRWGYWPPTYTWIGADPETGERTHYLYSHVGHGHYRVAEQWPLRAS